ncbi:CoA-transferase family III protein [Paenibacillus sp. oral taxon 786 str. D14]|uniref:CaiB/BaiF CoA transferase family protein n=1 Tax=Paenibacillus sp. oral taxon 786 TaxID=652715 RepID=UPI0001AFD478|nr:CaiB/BaiF CoA-transferase family protein [Paenibacillus sp. oral taxon 786]EES72372.1 CoA-transferase family III protein [Paenibacillus sp. oral taxon 786 str. D14]
MNLLDGIVVLDFSQYLAGPVSALRLADLGARVIKIERPGKGDGSRRLTLSNLRVDGESTVFQCMNRNKESYAADLKNPDDLEKVRRLVQRADVMIENFRPGTMEKLGLDYDSVKQLNPGIIYGSITGYGADGPWKNKPGQDLLVQAMSGLAWLNGNRDQPPLPFGLAVIDLHTSSMFVQAILALLYQRNTTRKGGYVEISLMEAALDFQFEVLSAYLNSETPQLPARSEVHNAHAYLGAPYGIYQTKDGHLALAMGSIVELGNLLQCDELSAFSDEKSWFERRDEIKRILVRHLKTKTTREWLDMLEPADYWCAEVMDWDQALNHEGIKTLDMFQEVMRSSGAIFKTTRYPVRINGQVLKHAKGAPNVGEDTEQINRSFQIGNS